MKNRSAEKQKITNKINLLGQSKNQTSWSDFFIFYLYLFFIYFFAFRLSLVNFLKASQSLIKVGFRVRAF